MNECKKCVTYICFKFWNKNLSEFNCQYLLNSFSCSFSYILKSIERNLSHLIKKVLFNDFDKSRIISIIIFILIIVSMLLFYTFFGFFPFHTKLIFYFLQSLLLTSFYLFEFLSIINYHFRLFLHLFIRYHLKM